MPTEILTDLQKALFQFQKDSDHLNAELRNREDADDPSIAELRTYLGVIGRKAGYVATLVKE